MIEFRDVSKVYPDGTTAVDHVSFTVPDNTTTVLVGSSGSGKSTLISMVNRMIDPTGGQVLVDGVDVATEDPVRLRRSIGYVLQQGGLFPHRTAIDNVAVVPRLAGASRAEARKRAGELLELVGIDAAMFTRYPAQLSGGQQQRVGVARALAAEANVLLMDEPFSAVDPIVRRELQQEVRRLQAELGKTVLFVTHDIDEAFALADDIIVLRPGGTIAQRGSAADLLAHPAGEFVADFLGINSGSRRLSVEKRGETTVVVDGTGRVVGAVRE